MDPFWYHGRPLFHGRSVINPLFDVPDSQVPFISGLPPRWLVIPWALGALEQDEFRALVNKPMWVRYIMGSSNQAAGFFANLTDLFRHEDFGDRLAIGANMSGSAKNPMVLKRPHLLLPNTPISGVVQNAANAAATGMIVLAGVLDRALTKPIRFPR
jgi:hypothetical protein